MELSLAELFDQFSECDVLRDTRREMRTPQIHCRVHTVAFPSVDHFRTGTPPEISFYSFRVSLRPAVSKHLPPK